MRWRYYFEDGRGCPGTTEIQRVACLQGQLAPQAKKVARTVGTPVHTAIEAVLLRQPKPIVPLDDESNVKIFRCLSGWMNWAAHRNACTPYAVEQKIVSEDERFAGAVDAAFELKDLGRTICDWKTSGSDKNFARLWPKYRLQIAAYSILHDEVYPPADHALILRLDSTTGQWEEFVIPIADLETERKVFRSFVGIYWTLTEKAEAKGVDLYDAMRV